MMAASLASRVDGGGRAWRRRLKARKAFKLSPSGAFRAEVVPFSVVAGHPFEGGGDRAERGGLVDDRVAQGKYVARVMGGHVVDIVNRCHARLRRTIHTRV